MWLWLRRRFLTGFFVTVPLFISVAALVWIFGVVDGLTTPTAMIAITVDSVPRPGIRRPSTRS